MATLSLCMIVKNEAARLTKCLESAAEVVQEIVIVDTGSTDDTASIAARFGARVSTFDFRSPDFSGARNQSIARANGDWILILDADELLTESAPSLVHALIEGEHTGYIVRRRNLRPPAEEVLVDYAVRLFPNHPSHRYRGRVHETIDAAILANGLKLRTTELTLDHILPSDDGRALEKSRFYLGILEEELAEDPDNVDRLAFRRAELHKLGLLDDATRTAERIAELAPEDVANHLHVGLYRLMHQRDLAGAERAFRRALELKPNDERALAYLRAVQQSDVR
jgi:glycosyltransferase involved in cell wall biosynthesis